jgi:hypothetical protein
VFHEIEGNVWIWLNGRKDEPPSGSSHGPAYRQSEGVDRVDRVDKVDAVDEVDDDRRVDRVDHSLHTRKSTHLVDAQSEPPVEAISPIESVDRVDQNSVHREKSTQSTPDGAPDTQGAADRQTEALSITPKPEEPPRWQQS